MTVKMHAKVDTKTFWPYLTSLDFFIPSQIPCSGFIAPNPVSWSRHPLANEQCTNEYPNSNIQSLKSS